MLCSCCVPPIVTSVYEQGARLGSALAVMLAAPGLNLAAPNHPANAAADNVFAFTAAN